MTRKRLHALPTLVIAAFVTLGLIAPLPAQAPAAGAVKKKVSDLVLGYWAIDATAMLKAMIAMAEEAGEDDIGEDDIADMKVMVAEMADSIVLEFLADGVARVHSADNEPDAKYAISEADDATGKFTMKITPEEEDTEIAQASVTDEKMSLKTEEMELHFVRLTREEARKRIAQIEKNAKEDVEP